MFSLPRLSLPSFARSQGGRHLSLDLPSVEIHDIETAAEKRARTLKHLLKANHANHAIIYHNLRFHNHASHILGSAYLLGGTAEHLNDIYETEARELEPWRDAPGEITQDDWREYLGRPEYQRAYVDFFEDQLVAKGYDLQDLLEEYLLGGKEPLINGLVAGLAHPLIHLGYAYELKNQPVTIEALAMGACCYNSLHKYIDDPKYTKPSPHGAAGQERQILDLLHQVREDKRFDGLYDHRSGNITKVLEECEEALLEYWNAWEIVNANSQFQAAQVAAVGLLVGTPLSDGDGNHDFFFAHVLTSSHAVRILLPLLPAKFHVNMLRQWWLFTLVVYIAQTRPMVDLDKSIRGYDRKGREWKYTVHQALESSHSKDAHYVKGLRAMRAADETWGDADHSTFWLNAAVKFADEFSGWGGFGTG